MEGQRRVKNCPGCGKIEILFLVLAPQKQILRQEFECNDLFRRGCKEIQVGRWGSEIEKRGQPTGCTLSSKLPMYTQWELNIPGNSGKQCRACTAEWSCPGGQDAGIFINHSY